MKLPALKESIVRSKVIERICRFLGIDLRQYLLLLDLFSTLGDRLEFIGVTASLGKVMAFYVLMSAMMALTAFTDPPLPAYLFIMIGSTMLFMFITILMDAANSIMNPDEASVLAHQPVRGASYVSAKVSHLLTVVAIVVPSLNLIPAVAGLRLRDAQWFYPLTHLLAAYLAGLFIAFLVCGIYGWLYRFVPPAKLKNAALWLQLISFVGLISVSNLSRFYHLKYDWLGWILNSSWMPWRWFIAIGLSGQAKYQGFSTWEAGAACILVIALVAFGMQSFRADYMASVSTLIQGSAITKLKPSRRSWLNPLVRIIAGAPSGNGAFSFLSIMFRRDWNFRRNALILALYFPLVIVVLANGIKKTPFVQGGFSIESFSLMHIFPHFLGISLAILCNLIPYSAEPKGADMFVSLPFGNLRPFIRGIYLSLWIPVAFLHLCLLIPCAWFWGVLPGALFVGFSLALVSLYLALSLFFTDGFPFATAFTPSEGNALLFIMLAAIIPILIFAGIQWIVFHNVFLVLGAAIILAVLGYATAQLSMGKMEKNIRGNLTLLGFAPSQMFKAIRNDTR